MRREKGKNQQILQELRESLDQREFSQEGEEGQSFAARVEAEIRRIKTEGILGRWGMKGADIRYDPKELGKRCRDARMKKGYPLTEVQARLSCKTHSYLSAIEHGKKRISFFMLEALSLLYHTMPKYLLGLEEKVPESAILLADRHIDRMRHHFKSVVQGTVMLTVQVLHTVSIGDLHDLTCAGVILASSVNLQLHAKIARAFAAEQRLRLVIIVRNHFIPPCMGMAIITERVIFIVILVVGIILMYNTPTAFTAGIVPIIAGLAEGRVFIPCIIIPVDTLSTAGADHGLLIGTAFAKGIVTHHDAVLQWVLLSTVTAGKSLSHYCHSP